MRRSGPRFPCGQRWCCPGRCPPTLCAVAGPLMLQSVHPSPEFGSGLHPPARAALPRPRPLGREREMATR
eukprot:12878173-Alexandrium_andersonii.AAC.1